MRWHRPVAGEYLSHDGQWLITQEWGLTFCDGPHPRRTGGMCFGQQEHPYTFWMISKMHNDRWKQFDKYDAARTLREAKAAVDQEVAREDSHRDGLRAVR